MQISVDVDADIDDIIDNCGAQEVLKRIDIDDIIKFINSHDAEDLVDSIIDTIDNFSEASLKMIAYKISDDAARTFLEAINIYHRDFSMETFKIYVCSPYSVFKDDKKKAREVAIKALAEANEYFNGDEKYELFSPVLSNSAYRNLSYSEVMAICLKQLDSCGAIFVPSEKTCDPDITQSSKGILMEMNHALINGYAIYDPGALFGAIEI